jgi:glycosyltransferase involved in cell wall biosynthesis
LIAREGIPKKKIRSVVIKEILERGWNKFPLFIRKKWNSQFFITEIFDIFATQKIVSCDVYDGLSSFSLRGMRKAKKMGAITVLDHGSSHILYQDAILREEYARFNVIPKIFQLAHPKIIEKELKEYAEADYITIPSLFVKRTFLEKGIPESKLIHVPYGVDLSVFHQIPKEDNVFRVIFGGGICFRKGVHYLLQAFSELNLPNSELLLLGSVSEEMTPFLEKYKGHYKQMSYRPILELHKWYSQGSVFVMPSLEEGLAMVQPQAMACGLPIITTTNSGAEDIVRDGKDGFIIPIRDVEKLKEKILFMYNNPEICKQMGQSAKERVSSGFTWDDYGRKIVSEYERILNEKNNKND